MPYVRRLNIDLRTRNSSRLHDRRVNETDKESRQRLETNLIIIFQARSIMTPKLRIQFS